MYPSTNVNCISKSFSNRKNCVMKTRYRAILNNKTLIRCLDFVSDKYSS